MSKKTSSAVKNRYNAKAYDNMRVVVPKGRKADIETHVRSTGAKSVNGLVNDLLREELGMTEAEWGYKREVPDDNDKPEEST